MVIIEKLRSCNTSDSSLAELTEKSLLKIVTFASSRRKASDTYDILEKPSTSEPWQSNSVKNQSLRSAIQLARSHQNRISVLLEASKIFS